MVYDSTFLDTPTTEVVSHHYLTDDILIVRLNSQRDKQLSSLGSMIPARTNKQRRTSRIIITSILCIAVIISFILLPEPFKLASLLFACPIVTQIRKIFRK